MITNSINERSDRYGVYMMSPSSDFDKQPIGKTTAHLADEVRDSLGAHLGGFAKSSPRRRCQGSVPGPARASCTPR